MKLKGPQDILTDTRYWTKYSKGLCQSCIGTCCYMPVEVKILDLINAGIVDQFFMELSEKELVKEVQRIPAIARYHSKNKIFTLSQKPNGSCYFLNDGLCSIYEHRPETCRKHPQVGPKPGYCGHISKDLKAEKAQE